MRQSPPSASPTPLQRQKKIFYNNKNDITKNKSKKVNFLARLLPVADRGDQRPATTMGREYFSVVHWSRLTPTIIANTIQQLRIAANQALALANLSSSPRKSTQPHYCTELRSSQVVDTNRTQLPPPTYGGWRLLSVVCRLLACGKVPLANFN